MGGAGNASLYLFVATEREVTRTDSRVDPVKEIVLSDGEDLSLKWPTRSVTTLSGSTSPNGEAAKR